MTPDTGPRKAYESSGKVDWLPFLPLSLGTGLVAVGMAWCLSEIFDLGYYYLGVAPLLAAMPVLGMALLAVGFGRCRNRLVATVLGLSASALMYLGYYDLCLARVVGVENALRPDLALTYLNWRMNTDQIGHPGLPAAKDGNAALNWMAFAFEFSLGAGLSVVALRSRAGRVYCEDCGRWTKRDSMKLPGGSSRKVLAMLEAGELDRLHRTSFGTVEWGGNSEVAVEYCDHRLGNGNECPVHFSIRDQAKQVDRPLSLGEKLGGYFQPRWNFKTVDALRQIELTENETTAIASAFAGLKRALGPASDPLRETVSDLRSAPRASASVVQGAIATIEQVPEGFAGTILTRAHAIVQTVIGLFPLVLLLGGGYVGLSAAERLQNPLIGILTVAGCLGCLIVLLFYINYFTARYMRGITWLAFAHRPDCWLDIREPGLLFVDIVPRSNWAKGMLETATDIGFLRVDDERRQLIFEGDSERYRIPGDAITSCKVEYYTAGTGNSATHYFMVVVGANTSAGPWETWFWQRHPDLRPYGKNRRAALAQQLAARIQTMMPVDEGLSAQLEEVS